MASIVEEGLAMPRGACDDPSRRDKACVGRAWQVGGRDLANQRGDHNQMMRARWRKENTDTRQEVSEGTFLIDGCILSDLQHGPGLTPIQALTESEPENGFVPCRSDVHLNGQLLMVEGWF
jgi:hypothetical protein